MNARSDPNFPFERVDDERSTALPILALVAGIRLAAGSGRGIPVHSLGDERLRQEPVEEGSVRTCETY